MRRARSASSAPWRLRRTQTAPARSSPSARRARSSPSSRDLLDDLERRRAVADPLARARLLLRRELVGGDPAERLADLRGVLVVDLHLDRLLVAGGVERDGLVLDVDDVGVDAVLVGLDLVGRQAPGRLACGGRGRPTETCVNRR